MIGRGTLLALSALAFAMGAPPSRARRVPPPVLEPLARSDWRAAGIGGTGCWWRGPVDARWRFAMSDRTAVIRAGGRIVTLVPGDGARAEFPFTFDRWRGSGVTVRLIRLAGGRRSGGEAMETPTRLVLIIEGRAATHDGRMACGS